jgi:putative ABC transport system ATP-binding protein
MLKLIDIRKSYQVGPVQLEVLKGANLTVERSDLLSIVGASGSGKSTIMNIIGLLDTPTSGSYYLEEREVSQLNDRELSKIRNQRIGFVFQQFNLISRLTALGNVALPLVYRGIAKRERDTLAKEMLEKVGLGDRVKHRPVELSGGQQQRVAIARAMVGKPSIILADEPTGALDSEVGKDIMDLFMQLNRLDKITIIIITHDHKVANQCRRVMQMDGGLFHETKGSG